MPKRVIEPDKWFVPKETLSNGCFETMRVYGGKIFRMQEHLKRLEQSATYLGTRFSSSSSIGLGDKLLKALKLSGLKEAVVRVALLPTDNSDAIPSIIVKPFPEPPASAYKKGMRADIVPSRKFPVGAVDHQAKYSARLSSVLALIDAQCRGADEALWIDDFGSVTESTASNFGIVRHGIVMTPPCLFGLLAGITRDVLWEIAKNIDISIKEVPLSRHEVYNADEAFLTSSLKEVMPVTNVDGRIIGTGLPGLVTRKLRKAFHALVKRECSNTRKRG